MELQQLRYLVALSKTLNFSKAAEEMFISQPTLSQQIRKLEEELDVRLVERSTRNVAMTPIGLACVKLAQQAVDASDRMIEITQEEQRHGQHKLNIGVLAVYPQLNISSVIAEFQSLHLTETINLHFGWSIDLLGRLLSKKSDIIITNLDKDQLSKAELESLDIHTFLSDRLYLIVGQDHPLAQRQTVGLAEVLSQRLFLPGARSSANLFFEKAVHAAGYQMPNFTECQSIMTALNFAKANHGASVFSRHVSESYVREGMRLIEITPTIWTWTAIVTRKEMLRHPLVHEFRNFFLECEARNRMSE
ncbi:MAG: LysR family transcriptional regulator [Christensenellales bacterium]|jgi:HTH_1 family transcriptional regulator